LFDYYRANPKLLQLATWYRLERELTTGVSEAAIQAGLDKIAAIQVAQDDGRIGNRFRANHLLTMVIALSQMGSPISVESLAGDASVAATRAAVVQAVAELTSLG
jgi:hypothetical protein